MKTKIAAAAVMLAVGSIFIVEFSVPAGANATGAPAGNTGSPGDGTNCTSCHTGSPSTQAGLITSTVPNTGYVPGQTYTITGSITASGKTKFGFQISPQNTAGVLKGTMAITNSTNTQLVSSGKYVTHKFAGTSFPSGTATWSFDWTAPAAGSGDVTFYGSFNATNSNSTTTGDAITLSSLVVPENLSTGIEALAASVSVAVYPNPFVDDVFIKNSANEAAMMDVSVIDINGKVVKSVSQLKSGASVNLQELATGVYTVRIETPEGTLIKRITKK
ncbi:MAG: choice-of-anchor V domain-containing protein [Bacteroidia bacterium]